MWEIRGCKVNVQRSVLFLYAGDRQLANKIKNPFHLQIHTKTQNM